MVREVKKRVEVPAHLHPKLQILMNHVRSEQQLRTSPAQRLRAAELLLGILCVITIAVDGPVRMFPSGGHCIGNLVNRCKPRSEAPYVASTLGRGTRRRESPDLSIVRERCLGGVCVGALACRFG